MTRVDTVRRRLDTNRGGGMAGVGSTAIIKVFVMALSGVLGLITSRLIIQHFGTDAYVQYGLLSTFPTLLPFADLGLAAVVINAVAGSASPRTDDQVRRTIVTAFRILIVSGGIMVAVSIVITAFGWWPALLGRGLMPGGNLAAGLCLIVYGIVVPMTVGQRILVGLKKTNVQVASQAVVAPLMLLVIGTFAMLMIPAGTYLAVVSYVANSVLSIICLTIAARAISPQIGQAIKAIPRLRSYPGVKAVHLAWPMLIQTVAMPLTLQTDRLLLSHRGTPLELGQYNLASQLFGLVLQTIAAAGIALWPIYAKARAQGRIESPLRPTLWFSFGALALGLLLAAVSPLLVHFIAGDKIAINGWLLVSFIAFVALQAAKYPVGMYMTDKAGLTFQVAPILVMIPLNLGLSWWLIGPFGAAGPIMGSAISVALCQVIPDFWYVWRDLGRRRALKATGGPASATTAAPDLGEDAL